LILARIEIVHTSSTQEGQIFIPGSTGCCCSASSYDRVSASSRAAVDIVLVALTGFISAGEKQGGAEAEVGDAITEAFGQTFDEAGQAQAAELISDGALGDLSWGAAG
jgi:hypothetical protein